MAGRITEEGMLKRARVLELRRQRWTFDQIAKDLGISAVRALQLYESALAMMPAANLEEHRAEELVLIDDATRHLMVIAKDEKASHHARIEAWNSIRGWSERKAKLLGLDAPDRHEVITVAQIDREIARLTAELSSRAETAEAATAA